MRPAGALLLALLLSGCSGAQYYAQAVSGHLDVMNRARPIDELLAESGTAPVLRAKLDQVRRIRQFAVAELGLPDNGSYRSYAALDRPFVVWNVFAAPELSIVPRESCFLFAGCVAYRGYYSRADADAYASELAKLGFDVFVAGVPAYSTLGWFDDPVLSTFVQYPEPELARLVFHELAHQVAYIKGDTMFNESFAVAVEREGVRRWLARAGRDADRRLQADYDERRKAFIALVLRYRDQLGALYRQALPDDDKRAGKRKLFAQMEDDYRLLKAGWGGFAGYDRWFAGVNNAHLASIATYTELVPQFEALLAREGGDLPKFYAAVRELAMLNQSARAAQLASFSSSAASPVADTRGGL